MFSLFTGDDKDKDQDFSEDLHKSFDAETSTHHMGETSSLYEEGPTECTKLSETQRTQNGNFGQKSLFRYNSKPYFMKKRQFFVLNAFDTIKMSALESRTILLRCLKLMVSQKKWTHKLCYKNENIFNYYYGTYQWLILWWLRTIIL